MAIHKVYSRQFTSGALEEWNPTKFMDYPAIMISNRYFSERRLSPCAEVVDFPPSVDPKGILQKLTGDRLIHTKENEVHYYQHREK